MRRLGLACVLLLLLLPRFLFAQTKPHPAEIRLDDGSTLRALLGIDAVPIVTKYGRLIVPLSDIRRIDFGLHVPAETQAAIDRAVKRLGSAVHKERLTAGDDLLAAGYFAAPTLRGIAKSPVDAETKLRAAAALARIADGCDLLDLPVHDMIHTLDMPIAGRLELDAIKAASPHLGEIELRVSGIRSVSLRANVKTELVVEANKGWQDTGMHADRGRRLVITAEGSVDLWPQTPGTYLSTPRGHNTTGEGGVFMAGSLVGRIGNGKEFVIGERLDTAVEADGRLWVRIVPSPWKVDSAGSYRVKVQTGR